MRRSEDSRTLADRSTFEASQNGKTDKECIKQSNEEHVALRFRQTGGKGMRGGQRRWQNQENPNAAAAAVTRTEKNYL